MKSPAETPTDTTPESAFPRRSRRIQLQRTMHRLIDPILSVPNAWRARQSLGPLPAGDYRVPMPIPYVAQFASPERIKAYIHDALHGRDDPAWSAFGAPDPDTYTFWAHRACAIACLKMAVDGFGSAPRESMYALTEAGIQHGGYITHDATGAFVDMGWLYAGLVKLAETRGLTVRGMAYASVLDVCAAIRDGWVVAAAVTPEIGEPEGSPYYRVRRYDGHFVLVYGFRWNRGCTHLLLHNPSGRSAEMQADAAIPIRRFRAAFAHRFIAFRSSS